MLFSSTNNFPEKPTNLYCPKCQTLRSLHPNNSLDFTCRPIYSWTCYHPHTVHHISFPVSKSWKWTIARLNKTAMYILIGCSKGYYYPNSCTSCEACPIGTYNNPDNYKGVDCKPCFPDWITPQLGADSFRDCFPSKIITYRILYSDIILIL